MEFLAGEDDDEFEGENGEDGIDNENEEEEEPKNGDAIRGRGDGKIRKGLSLQKREDKFKGQMKKIRHKKIKVAFENAEENYNEDLLN